MLIPINQKVLFEEFRKYGYTISGNLESTLTLEKLPIGTKLRSKLIANNLENGLYLIKGNVYADGPDIEIIGVDETENGIIALYRSDVREILIVNGYVPKNKVLRELGLMVLTTFESYFGESNREVHRKLNDVYRIQPTL